MLFGKEVGAETEMDYFRNEETDDFFAKMGGRFIGPHRAALSWPTMG